MEKKKKTTKSREDQAVQGTNDSSIVSKCSMAAFGYFQDEYLQHFVAKKTRRSPLIHRGYYIRAKAVDHCFHNFLGAYDEATKTQVISLGAGFDSAYFRLKSQGKLKNTVYFEVDFPQVMTRKLALIKQTKELQDLISSTITHGKQDPSIVLHTRDYVMLGVDLTDKKKLNEILNAVGCTMDRPTLFLSEVALAYMKPQHSTAVLQWAAQTFENGVIVLYEQIIPDDAFGIFMQRHFTKLGSPLRTLPAYPTIADQLHRITKSGWSSAWGLDMNQFYYNMLAAEEHQRLEQLEVFDEYEEWHLKCTHYALLCGACGVGQKAGSRIMQPANDKQGGVAIMMTSTNHKDSTPETLNISENKMKDVPKNKCFSMTELNLQEPRFVRFGHTCTKVGDIVVCIGGFGATNNGHKRLSDVILYDTVRKISCKWTPFLKETEINGINPLERMYHTASKLSDGSLMVIGGRTSPMRPLDTCVHVNLIPDDTSEAQGQTQVTCSVVETSGGSPCARWKHSAVVANVKGAESVIVYGGRTTTALALGDCYVLNTTTHTWTQIGSTAVRHSHSACVHAGFMYVTGGLEMGSDLGQPQEVPGVTLQPSNTILVLNLDTLMWDRLQPQGQLRCRYSHSCHVVGDSLVLVGGVDITKPSPGVATVNLTTGLVTEYNMPAQDPVSPLMLHNHASVLDHDNNIIVLGGGGNCFSFGTHLNLLPIKIDFDS